MEVQAAGRPVVAFAGGGALETVVDGVTGVLFEEQTVDSMIGGMEALEAGHWNPARCRGNAERFDAGEFRRRMRAAVDRELRALHRPAGAPQVEVSRAGAQGSSA